MSQPTHDSLSDSLPPFAAPLTSAPTSAATPAAPISLPTGIPMPSAPGSLSVPPTSTTNAMTTEGTSAHPGASHLSPDEEKHALATTTDGATRIGSRSGQSSSGSSGSLDGISQEKEKAGLPSSFEKPGKQSHKQARALLKQEMKEKKLKEKEKEKERPTTPPIGFFALFRYHTPLEKAMNCLALVLAAAAGATQPLMTLIFGNLTTAFTNFAIASANALTSPGPETSSTLSRLSSELKKTASLDALYLVAIGGGMFICTYSYMVIFQYTAEVAGRRIREKYLEAVLRQDIAYFDDLGAGEVSTRVQSDTHLVHTGMGEKVPISVSFMATFITGFVLAFTQSWKLALALSSILPVIVTTGGIMGYAMTKYTKASLDHVAEAGSLAEEAFSSVRTVHAFGMLPALGKIFDTHILKAATAQRQASLINAGGLCVMFFAIYSAYALAFFFGAILITQGQATSGTVVTVFLSVLIGSFSMAMLAPEATAVTKALGAAAKLYETIERVPLIDSASTEGLQPETCEGRITLEDVVFHYPSRPDVPILKTPGLSLDFAPGTANALVGASGSGKSTVAALVLRFYDPIAGRVLLDGRDIKTLNVNWLRRQIGLVQQEPTLFGRSVRANIETGLIGSQFEHLSAAEKFELVKEACVKANAHDFIMLLPDGYDTECGERGMLLSGGQKQRVAIARAIISDPKILILDEATSALDGKSESIVQEALDKAAKGRTSIAIAHRLATVKNSNQIVVMGDGAVIETGTHNTLLSNPEGAYALLVSAQKLAAQRERQAGDAVTDQTDLMRDNAKAEMPDLARAQTNKSGHSTNASAWIAPDEDDDANESRFSFPYLAKRMYKINRKQKWLYVICIIAAIAGGMVYPALAIVFGKAISSFSIQDPNELKREANLNALWFFVTAIASACAIFLQNGGLGITAETLTGKLRSMTFRSFLRSDIAFFDEEQNNSGVLTSNLSDWPQKFNGLAGITLGAIIQSCSTLVGGLIIGLIYEAKLAAVGLACMPLLVSAGWLRLKLVVQVDQKNRKAHSKSAHLASESAGAVRTVASLTMEGDVCRVHHESLEAPFRNSIRSSYRNNLLYAASQGMSFLVIALVFWYGANLIADGKMAVASFFTVLNSVVFASIQAGNVFNFVPDMSKAQSSSTSILRQADHLPDIDMETTEGIVLDPKTTQGHLRFEDVHFRYPSRPGVKVLRGLNLDIPVGKYVALVGPSGCGKSTTIGLLERFYDPVQGKVTLDGVDISTINVSSYRGMVSLVAQDPILYAGTIRFNLTMGGRPGEEVTEDQLIRACQDANIYDFIKSLPEGFDTFVGNKGSQFSGGQRQRMCIARALVRDPKVLLLDEATSALDAHSEKSVQAAIDRAVSQGKRTILSIAHRLSTIQNADIIYFFKEGRITEKGTHQELLALRGGYFELTKMQSLSKLDE